MVLYLCISSFGKFQSFCKEIIDAQRSLFYACRITYDPFCSVEINTQTWFHVYTKVQCCEKHVCGGKILFEQSNRFYYINRGCFFFKSSSPWNIANTLWQSNINNAQWNCRNFIALHFEHVTFYSIFGEFCATLQPNLPWTYKRHSRLTGYAGCW